MSAAAEDRVDFDNLAPYLTALASPARLELLHLLRTPKSVREITLRPTGHDAALRRERSITDQAVRKHLAKLEDAGLVVTRRGKREGAPVEERLVNHQMLFAVVEQLREVARLPPTVHLEHARTMTIARGRDAETSRGPRLIQVHGRAEGTTYSLGTKPPRDGAWVVGRRQGLAVTLDHDPYISLEHAAVVPAGAGFAVRDLPRSKNGTWLNWRAVPRGSTVPIVTGDVVGLGKTLLLFRVDGP